MTDILPSDEPDGYQTRTTSSGGDFVWIVSPAEWAASQWVLAEELWRKDAPTCLFRPPDDWSFEGRDWIFPLRLDGRRFPGVMPGITLPLDVGTVPGIVEVDAGDRRVRARPPPAAPTGMQPFSVLLAWLTAYQTRQQAAFLSDLPAAKCLSAATVSARHECSCGQFCEAR
jgi:hypothetical protein